MISDRREHPLPKRDAMPRQPHAAALLRATSSGKYEIFSSFAQKTPNAHTHTQKNALSKPNLSSTDATFKTVSHLKGSSARTVACEAAQQRPFLTPVAGDASHPKNAVQGQAEIPTFCCTLSHRGSVQHTSLGNRNLEQFIVAECP